MRGFYSRLSVDAFSGRNTSEQRLRSERQWVELQLCTWYHHSIHCIHVEVHAPELNLYRYTHQQKYIIGRQKNHTDANQLNQVICFCLYVEHLSKQTERVEHHIPSWSDHSPAGCVGMYWWAAHGWWGSPSRHGTSWHNTNIRISGNQRGRNGQCVREFEPYRAHPIQNTRRFFAHRNFIEKKRKPNTAERLHGMYGRWKQPTEQEYWCHTPLGSGRIQTYLFTNLPTTEREENATAWLYFQTRFFADYGATATES